MPHNPLESIHEQAEAAFLPYGENFTSSKVTGKWKPSMPALRKARVALMD